MQFENIDISSIDLADHTFLIGDPTPQDGLKESIRSFGQINPVVLTYSEKKIKIITGWKRVQALKELGVKSVVANIYSFKKNKIPDFLYTIYFDNKPRFTDLDKAEVINRFKVLCGFTDQQILEKVLPTLSIKPSKNNLKKYTIVTLLSDEIKKLFHNDYFTFEQLVMLSELEDENYQDVVFNKVLKKFRFNNNETREILREIYEISKRDKLSFDECIENIFSNIGSQPNKNDFKKKVRFMRYPNLMKAEEKFKEASNEFQKIKNLNLFHHPYFETNEIELRLKVTSLSEYVETLNNLSDSKSVEKIEDLLKLVKEGK